MLQTGSHKSDTTSLWEADERFQSNIDKHGDGLTALLVFSVRAAGDAI